MRKKLQRPAQTLRNPGQSLDEEIERTIHDDFLSYFLLAMLMWVICLLEWLGQYLHSPRQPGIYAASQSLPPLSASGNSARPAAT